jgi:hypothetical protein
MYNIPSFGPKIVDAFSDTFYTITRDRWGIYCLTPDPASILMWSHYADNHRGICLEFASDTQHSMFAWARRVIYRCAYPRLLMHRMDEAPVQILLSKSDHWSYEDEFRIIGTRTGTLGSNPALPLITDGFLDLAPGLLKSVIAGYNADYAAIKAIVKRYTPDLPVKRAVKASHIYSLEIHSEADAFVAWQPSSFRRV